MSTEECNCVGPYSTCFACQESASKAQEETCEELLALRAWKEKARPFLESYRKFSRQYEGNERVFTELTELLGGKDE